MFLRSQRTSSSRPCLTLHLVWPLHDRGAVLDALRGQRIRKWCQVSSKMLSQERVSLRGCISAVCPCDCREFRIIRLLGTSSSTHSVQARRVRHPTLASVSHRRYNKIGHGHPRTQGWIPTHERACVKTRGATARARLNSTRDRRARSGLHVWLDQLKRRLSGY
jgi:hypothetical protein